jgi:hypothetical protein
MAKPRALFHPDCDRRPRDRTESADPTFLVERGRSRADAIARNHRRWGLSPRPENACPGTIPKRRNYPVCAGNWAFAGADVAAARAAVAAEGAAGCGGAADPAGLAGGGWMWPRLVSVSYLYVVGC